MSPQSPVPGWGPLDNPLFLPGAASYLSRQAAAEHPAPSKTRPLFPPLPVGEGCGEGLPAEAPRTTRALVTPPGLWARTLPSPRGDLCNTPRALKCGAARAPSPRGDLCITRGAGVRCRFPRAGAVLSPLQGERQVRASSAETGEGSSGQPSPGCARVSLLGDLSKIPSAVAQPAPTAPEGRGTTLFKKTRLFTLSEGRGRTCPEPAEGFRRLRRKSVRGLPRNQQRVTHSFLWADGQVRKSHVAAH